MAKSVNVYTRGLKQRLGGVVWYQRKGETIARELAASVENPQTDAQMDQRVKLANVVSIYRANKQWMEKYAFENRKQGLSVYNAFVSANLSQNDITLTKEQTAVGAGVAAEYMFTKGTLPQMSVSVVDEGIFQFLDIAQDDNFTSLSTIADLSTALLNAGWRAGDQLSVIVNKQKTIGGIPYVFVDAYEFIVNTSDTRTLFDVNYPVYAESNIFGLDLSLDYDYDAVGVCVIHSRDTENGVAVSSSIMTLDTLDGQDPYKGTEARQKARRSYSKGTATPFLAGGYYEGAVIPEPLPAAPDIVSVALGEGAAVEDGGVIAVTPAATTQTMIINFADAIDEALELGQVTVWQKDSANAGPAVIMGQYTIGSLRSQLTCTGIFSSTNNISKVIVDFSNGEAKEIDFTPTVAE